MERATMFFALIIFGVGGSLFVGWAAKSLDGELISPSKVQR